MQCKIRHRFPLTKKAQKKLKKKNRQSDIDPHYFTIHKTHIYYLASFRIINIKK
jgi:hypothetical protein